MVTGEIKNKIDQIWDTFFVAGITNPITVLEQMMAQDGLTSDFDLGGMAAQSKES